MFKKLAKMFKKKEDNTIEELGKKIAEAIDENGEEVEVEEIEPKPIKTIEFGGYNITPNTEVDSFDKEMAEWHSTSYDVDTSFRFEVYVGEDEYSVKLANDKDFDTIEDAIEFAKECIAESSLMAFIHEEINEQGEKILTRHMVEF